MRRNGFAEARDPILKPLDTIECRDAILTTDSAEPEWPPADVVIGNPPFLGGKRLITMESTATTPPAAAGWIPMTPRKETPPPPVLRDFVIGED